MAICFVSRGFEEHLLAIRAVGGPDPVHFEGRYYRIPEADIGPKPVRPGGPRLIAGAPLHPRRSSAPDDSVSD